MSRLFVFDMDDVIYDYDGRARIAKVAERTGHDDLELRRRWWNREGEGAAEAGAFVDGASYLAAVNAALGSDFDVDDWVAIRRGAMTPRPEVIGLLAALAPHGRVTLLTNNGPLAQERISELAPELLQIFGLEHLRTSSFYGARKPDRAVYERVLEHYGAAPSETLFVDDLAVNVEGAAGLGIVAHRYTDPASLRSAVEDFLGGPLAQEPGSSGTGSPH